MSDRPHLAFSHIGIWVTDPERMERFYTSVLGFTVTDRGSLGATRLVFLSQDPTEHHQIVLASGRPAELPFNVINQISLRAADLAAVKAIHRRVRDEGMAEISPVTHGNAISVYFRDPEGNRVEVFIDTPWYVSQPLRMPLDLDQPDHSIWRAVEAECRRLPGFKPRPDWEAEMRARMNV